jgi:tungstate transport system ATP-binding protein
VELRADRRGCPTAIIECTGISRTTEGRTILDGISLEIQTGEIFTLIGPSGSGKTTLLRLLDLLDMPSAGRLVFDGTDTDAPEPVRLAIRRRMSMVFQKPVVLNTTVLENVAFGLKFRGKPLQESRAKALECLELVGLSGFACRRAITLSGGEMQRVALARAMVTEPEVILLDEPTANLDPVSSEMIEDLIVHINRKLHTTIILSTHDMVQGQRLADRIGVIMNGTVSQTGSITEIFYQPKTRGIARFVGVDTILKGVVKENDHGLAKIAVGDILFEALTPALPGCMVSLFIRPEEVVLSKPEMVASITSARNQITGTITKIVPIGPFIRVIMDDKVPIISLITRRSCTEMGFIAGMQVVASIKATAIFVLPDT